MKKMIILLLIMVSGMAYAEETGCICGKVIDTKTKEPLIGVNILVLGTNKGGITDINGEYRIMNLELGTYRLEYRFIGYKSYIQTDIVVNPVKSNRINIEMIEEGIEVEGVTVSAGYFDGMEKTQVSSTSLIREEIRRFPGGFEDVTRTVSTLPGVAVNLTGGRNDLLVRGGGPSENLYLINNLEVPNINHFGTQGSSSGSLSFINLDFVDKVNFSSGGFSVRYGDKMSSVLELDLSKGRQDKLGYKGLISATQFGVSIQGPVSEKSTFIFSARKSYLDFIFKAAGLPFVPVYTDYNFILDYDVNSTDKIFFFSLLAIDQVDRDQSSEENRVVNSGIMDNTQNQWISGINYRHLIYKGYMDFSYGLNWNDYRFSQADSTELEFFKSNAHEIENNFKFQIYRQFSSRIGFFNGVSFKQANIENNTVFADSIYNRSGQKISIKDSGLPGKMNENESFQKSAFFSEMDWILSPRLDFTGGFRGDYYGYLNENFYVSPRASLKFTIDNLTRLKFSAGFYHQSPSYVWVMNRENRALKALKNKMFIAGLERKVREDLKLQIEVYYKDYTDLPTGKISGLNDYFVLTNGGAGFGGREDDFQSFGYYSLISNGKGNSKGLELILIKKFSQTPLYGQFSVTYSKSEYIAGNGEKSPGIFDQPLIVNLSGGYKWNEYWEFSGKFRYFSGVPYTPVYRPQENPLTPGEIQSLPEEYLMKRLAPGHQLDIRVDRYFYFGKKELILFVDIQNIYNFQTPIIPRYDFWNDKIEDKSNIALLPTIGISFEF